MKSDLQVLTYDVVLVVRTEANTVKMSRRALVRMMYLPMSGNGSISNPVGLIIQLIIWLLLDQLLCLTPVFEFTGLCCFLNC